MDNPIMQQLQDRANNSVQEYLSNLSDLSCSKLERIKSEKIALDSLTYLVDRHTKQYKKRLDYQDLRQDAWMIITQRLQTFDYNQGSQFTYWAALALQKIIRPAIKDHRRNKTMILTDSVPLSEKDRNLSAFQLLAAKEKLQQIKDTSSDDWKILSEFINCGSISEVNRNLGHAKEGGFTRAELSIRLYRMAKELDCTDFEL